MKCQNDFKPTSLPLPKPVIISIFHINPIHRPSIIFDLGRTFRFSTFHTSQNDTVFGTFITRILRPKS